MIEYLEKLIFDNWPDWVGGEKFAELTWLKIHAGEGWRNRKVGLFAFNGRQPVIFAKTVRTAADNRIIEDGFRCLQQAYAIEPQSAPRPLYLGDYQGLKFSLETAVVGRQFHSCKKRTDLDNFLNWFYGFQKSMKLERTVNLNDEIGRLAGRFVDCYRPLEETRGLISDFINDLATAGDLVLPAIGQHGDLTPDNVLADRGRIRVIDWEHFGKIDLPLFDLLTFLQRWSCCRDAYFVVEHSKIIEDYLREFGIQKSTLKTLVFGYYLWDFLRKKERLTDYDQEFLIARLKELKTLKI